MHGGHSGIPSGFDFVHLAEELQGIEAAGAIDFTALRQRRQDASNKAVNVKQWHDIQAAIRAAKARAVCNVLSRSTDVAMRQRNNLGAGSGARGVKHQGHIVRLCMTRMLCCFGYKSIHVQCE